MRIGFNKTTIIDRLLLCATVVQVILLAISIIHPMDAVNYVMYVMNYVIGFLAICSLVMRNVSAHFMMIAFLGCFMLFLMGQKPFKPDYDVFLTFKKVQLDTRQYVAFSSMLFLGLAGTYYSYMFFHRHKSGQVRRNEGVNRAVLERILTVMLLITFPFALYMQAKIVFVKGGMDYTAGYLVNVDIPALVKIGCHLYEAVILIYLAIKPKKKRMFLALGTYLLIEGGIQLLQGRRALFAAILLFSVWYLLKYYNIVEIRKRTLFLLLALSVAAVFLFIIVEQTRDGATKELSLDAVGRFFVSTGGSDSVIANTIVRKDKFPRAGYLYLLDPFVNNFVGNILRGKTGVAQGLAHVIQHNSFSHWISFLTDSALYLSGHGMGSSYLAEAYLAFGMLGVVLATLGVGWVIHKLDGVVLGRGVFSVAVAFFFARRIFTLPRDSMFGWAGEMIYLLFSFAVVGAIYLLWNKRSKMKVQDSDEMKKQQLDKKECSTVTVGVIALNEHQYLPDLLQDLLEQTYPKHLTEVILVDGNSSDDTKQIMESFCAQHLAEYRSIQVLDNPRRVQPVGWNIVIKNSAADVILRIDAHARIPNDFIQNAMACINSGEDVCGGPRENMIDEDTPWKRMLLDAEQSLFGSGFATYRRETEEKRYVKSVFHGAYRREVFAHAGGFNENLIRTEDNEIHYRLRKHGYQICYDPSIRSYYQTRNTLPKMLKQKYQNGLWIGKTLYVSPGCISLFHLVPFVFVCVLGLFVLLALLRLWWPLAALMAVYVAFLVTNMLFCLLKTKNPTDLFLPVVYFLMHIVYGVGTITGILKKERE